jgi:hypothetical protein
MIHRGYPEISKIKSEYTQMEKSGHLSADNSRIARETLNELFS